MDEMKVFLYSRSEQAIFFYVKLLHAHLNLKIFSVTGSMKQNIINLIHCDVIQILSADLKGFYGFVWCILFVLFKLINKPVFFYWIGSDVTVANKYMLRFSSYFITANMTHAPWLVTELQKKGIYAKFTPNPIADDRIDPPPLPQKFTILVYLGHSNRDVFYGGNVVDYMIQNLPYNFIILGGSKQLQNTEKVQYFSKVNYKEMRKIYAQTSVLVRIIEHDALSNMVQESLNYGRHVIWSMKFPYCHYANTYESTVKILEELYKKQNLNIAGMEYYRHHFDRELCAEQFIDFYRRVKI